MTLLLLVLGGTALGGERPSQEKTDSKVEMTSYQLVLLKTGPNGGKTSDAEADRLQTEHLKGLKAMVDRGQALAVGPVKDGGELRGIAVLDVAGVNEARDLFKDDPWIRSGHLIAEIHPWFAAKNIFRKPPVFLDVAPCFFALLKRPRDAPQFPEKKLEELQAGHMANINRIADSGDLVIAGPLSDDGVIRGVLVFRTPTADAVRQLVARDPSIQARRLEMELYTWLVSKGVIPPAPAKPAS